MSFQFSPRSQIRMMGIHPHLILVLNLALELSPIDFGIPKHGGHRTVADQQWLFHSRTADGRTVTKVDGINTISTHQLGMAFDIYAYVNGKASWDKVHLALVAGTILTAWAILKKEGKVEGELKWGGTFGSTKFHGWDYPHFELICDSNQ